MTQLLKAIQGNLNLKDEVYMRETTKVIRNSLKYGKSCSSVEKNNEQAIAVQLVSACVSL